MKKILFVCTGNTCRSVMAEWLFNTAILPRNPSNPDYSACSAGISAFGGEPPNIKTLKVLEDKWGIDASPAKSRLLSQGLADEAWLILAMTCRQRDFIKTQYPDAVQKTFTLKEYINVSENTDCSGSSHDIQDPFGLSEQYYIGCALEVEECLSKLANRL